VEFSWGADGSQGAAKLADAHRGSDGDGLVAAREPLCASVDNRVAGVRHGVHHEPRRHCRFLEAGKKPRNPDPDAAGGAIAAREQSGALLLNVHRDNLFGGSRRSPGAQES